MFHILQKIKELKVTGCYWNAPNTKWVQSVLCSTLSLHIASIQNVKLLILRWMHLSDKTEAIYWFRITITQAQFVTIEVNHGLTSEAWCAEDFSSLRRLACFFIPPSECRRGKASYLKEAEEGGDRSVLALEVLKALHKRCAASFLIFRFACLHTALWHIWMIAL